MNLKRILCLLASLAVLSMQALAATPPVEADRVVAVVNSEAITLYELRARVASIQRQLQKQNVPIPAREEFERQVLERMVVDHAQLQFAKESGVIVSDSDLDLALKRIADSNHVALSDFRATIERDGLPWSKFREDIRNEMTLSRLREREVDNRVVVSDGEIENYLANAAKNTSMDYALAHILVRLPENASADQIAKLRAKIEKAQQKISQGENFAKVAAQFSDAPDALSGGTLDLRPLDRLPTLYADVVQNMKPGDVSPILRSPAGFHIVKLLDKRGASVQTQAIRQTHARHILIKVNDLVSDDEAKRKLIGLKERLDHGASFAELAKLNSNDISATRGGDLGWLDAGATVPEFEKAMDALPLNTLSEPVRSPFGWHLIEVLERRTNEGTTESRRAAARQALRERKADEAYQDWLRQTRDRAYVEYHLDDK